MTANAATTPEETCELLLMQISQIGNRKGAMSKSVLLWSRFFGEIQKLSCSIYPFGDPSEKDRADEEAARVIIKLLGTALNVCENRPLVEFSLYAISISTAYDGLPPYLSQDTAISIATSPMKNLPQVMFDWMRMMHVIRIDHDIYDLLYKEGFDLPKIDPLPYKVKLFNLLERIDALPHDFSSPYHHPSNYSEIIQDRAKNIKHE
jgi:hypothetical protein